MNARRAGDSWWPTRRQELLLQAALLQGLKADQAWELWKAGANVDQLDPDAQRWLPHLYRALRSRAISHPEMTRFKGVYRRVWYENQLLFHSMTDVLRALDGAGVRTVLLKGAALVVQYYRDYGLRSMEDFDVLVTPDQAPAAVAVLRGLGFTPVWDTRPDVDVFASRHGWDFKNGAGRQVDLHWQVFHDHIGPSPDDEFWSAAVPRMIGGVPTATLNAADQLLHVIVHGTAWDPEPSVRWVADAMAILRSAPDELDWNRLLRHARRYQYVLLLRVTLRYLREALDAPVPLPVLQQLEAAPVSRAERIIYTGRTRPRERWGPWLALCMAYLEGCATASPSTSALRRLAALPRYLQSRWGARSVWHVPIAAAFRATRRMGWAARPPARRLQGTSAKTAHRPASMG
jgi:Uncharacterised nucleotidyltransferase